MPDQSAHSPTRRSVLIAAPVAAVALGAAACSSDDSSAPPADDVDTASGAVLAATADVPVGGGVVVGDVVVTQPTAGEFVAFSTTCPHQGCAVAPKNGELDCPCHGSRFGLDGSLLGGPAMEPLSPVEVVVEGTDVVRA